jgi:hypothetical protein
MDNPSVIAQPSHHSQQCRIMSPIINFPAKSSRCTTISPLPTMWQNVLNCKFLAIKVPPRSLHLRTGRSNRLVTDKRVEFEKWTVQVQDLKQIADHFRRIQRTCFRLMKKNRKYQYVTVDLENTWISTDLPKVSPDMWRHHSQKYLHSSVQKSFVSRVLMLPQWQTWPAAAAIIKEYILYSLNNLLEGWLEPLNVQTSTSHELDGCRSNERGRI